MIYFLKEYKCTIYEKVFIFDFNVKGMRLLLPPIHYPLGNYPRHYNAYHKQIGGMIPNERSVRAWWDNLAGRGKKKHKAQIGGYGGTAVYNTANNTANRRRKKRKQTGGKKPQKRSEGLAKGVKRKTQKGKKQTANKSKSKQIGGYLRKNVSGWRRFFL